jgi:CheY-like chemotaxis protein
VEVAGSAARVRLRLVVEDGGMVAAGDATRIRQILLNLLGNAVKYNRPGGDVELRLRRRDGSAIAEVRDTGIGMNAAQLQRLFAPFERLGREHHDEGTGIGLVIAKSLADLMGGSLQVSSEAGRGSTFTLTLRLAQGPLLPMALPTSPAAAPGLERYGGKRVIYVEDNEVNVEVMRAMLGLRPQIELTACADGKEAVATLQRVVPDLLLVDRQLPDIDGLELLKRLRADPRLLGVPMVVVSADALPSSVSAAHVAGATQYLTKPLTVESLLAVVDPLLAEAVEPS